MAWTVEHRRAADRRGLRYPSDLTDAEWALVAPLIRPAKRGGRPRTVDVREVLNAIFYVLSTGCQWAALPKDLPPKSTVWDYFSRWEWEGTIARIHHVLYVAVREQAGREGVKVGTSSDRVDLAWRVWPLAASGSARSRLSGELGHAASPICCFSQAM